MGDVAAARRRPWAWRRCGWCARCVSSARFLAEVAPAQPVRIDLGRARAALEGDNVEIAFGDAVVVVPDGTTLLEAAETAGVAIEAGCRQGVCGADPVAVIDGIEQLSPRAFGGDRHLGATRSRRTRTAWPAWHAPTDRARCR